VKNEIPPPPLLSAVSFSRSILSVLKGKGSERDDCGFGPSDIPLSIQDGVRERGRELPIRLPVNDLGTRVNVGALLGEFARVSGLLTLLLFIS